MEPEDIALDDAVFFRQHFSGGRKNVSILLEYKGGTNYEKDDILVNHDTLIYFHGDRLRSECRCS